ncbi:MAG TPA: hypothetical protein VHX60_02020 [Acidobacteriaceae bacterium]|jgi:hypothetical protein|nr:hypothetical protein [Acidobacteriaceae bacterium]
MPGRTISIPVDSQTERAWGAIRAEERRKIEAVLGLWLRELAVREPESLANVLDEAGRAAQARGITPAILDSLLKGA